jgi:hypothetical protein
VKWERARVYGERVWFECASVASVESAPCSTMRASVSGAAVLIMLVLVMEARRVSLRVGSRTSVEGGVGTECVCVCELDSRVCTLEGDMARRGGEWYSGGVGASDGSRRCGYARMLGARRGVSASASARGGKVWIV